MKTPKATRRSILAWLAAAPALAFTGSALAQAKRTKKAVKYRDKPNDGKDCDDCFYFIRGNSADSPGACTIVEGEISPNGWCAEFKQKV